MKIFETGKEVNDDTIQKRIEADMTMLGGNASSVDQSLVGRNWKEVALSESKIHYYSKEGTKIYQVQMATSGKVKEKSWYQEFWDGFKL